MANLKINNNVISSLRTIESPDVLTEKLLQILEQSLLQQADSGGRDKSNLGDLKKIYTLLQENEFDTGMKQQQIMAAYEKSIKSVEEVMESYGDKENGILQKKVDDFLSDVPGLKDIASALQKENPIIGQTWKAISGTWNFAKKRIQKSKEAKEKHKSNTKLLETQAKDIHNLEKTSEEAHEDNKESSETHEEILIQILDDIQNIRDNTDQLKNLNDIPKLTDSKTCDKAVEIDNVNESQTIENVSNNEIGDFVDTNGVVIEHLDNIDEHIKDGIKDIIKYMSTSDEKEKREGLLTRLRNTKTTIDPNIKKIGPKEEKESEHDKESKSFFSSMSSLMKIAKPILAMFGIGAVSGILNFLTPIKTLFSVLGSIGSSIMKFLPTILRIGGRVAIIGTIVMAIYDFVDGFAKTFEIFENQDEVSIFDRIHYAYTNIIGGFIKLFDNILGWFGLNFLDENTTQEDITNAIFEFNNKLINSVKNGLNHLLDWLSDLLPDWAVPDFRFDTSSSPKFKDESGNETTNQNGSSTTSPKRIFDKSVTDTYESIKTSISESSIGDAWRYITGSESSASVKFNAELKDYEKEAAKLSSSKQNTTIANSGNQVNNIVNNSTSNSKSAINTSNPDLNFRSAVRR